MKNILEIHEFNKDTAKVKLNNNKGTEIWDVHWIETRQEALTILKQKIICELNLLSKDELIQKIISSYSWLHKHNRQNYLIEDDLQDYFTEDKKVIAIKELCPRNGEHCRAGVFIDK